MRAAALSKTILLAGFLALAACGDSPESETPVANASEPVVELTLHRMQRPGAASVNSYILEGPDAVLVFDTQWERELAARVIERVQEIDKPVTAIVISHYHPDHFGGLAQFAEAFPDAQIIMAEGVADQISNDPEDYVAALRTRHGDDFQDVPAPNLIVEAGDEIDLSGVSVLVHVVPEAEASPMLMLSIPSQNIVLSSDLVVNGMHPNMADADLDSWPRALERASRDFSDYTLHPGHGEPGQANLLIANQIGYLNFMRNLINSTMIDDDMASEPEFTEAIAEIRSTYPDWQTTTGRPAQLRRNLESLIVQLGGRIERQRSETPAPRE